MYQPTPQNLLSIDKLHIAYPDVMLNICEEYQQLDIPAARAKVYHRLYGFSQLPMAREMTETVLLKQAAQGLLNKLDDPGAIKYVIHAHTSPEIGVQGTPVLKSLQRQLGLEHAIWFGSQSNKCLSVVSAMQMADKLLANNSRDKVMVLVGEVADSPNLRLHDSSLIGDIGTAFTLQRKGDRHQILSENIAVHGEFAEGIYMSGETAKNYESHYQQNMCGALRQAIDSAGVTLEQIKLLLPHNVNVHTWTKAAKAIGLPADKIMLKNVALTGHCFGADMLLNIHLMEQQHLIAPGDIYVYASAGVGGTFGATVIKF